MAFALGPRATKAGYKLIAFETIDSTNSEAMRRWDAGERGPVWLVAKNQSHGRGRRGRVWQTIEGNLATSLLLGLDLPPDRMATLGFVAGLALSDALLATVPGLASGHTGGRLAKVALKWPNDVTIDEGKVAGIMLESESNMSAKAALVVGIGVNIIAAPVDTPYPATCLRNTGATISAETVFAALSDAWIDRYESWTADGFASIREAWLLRAQGIGGPLSVRSGTHETHGTFETVDEQGHLIVRGANGKAVPVAAGDVHFGAAASLHATG